jgi:hypothetical protein
MATLIVLSDLVAPAVFRRGGHAMYVLQWLHGLERVGQDVLFVEFLKEHPGESTAATVRYFQEVMTDWWHPERSALVVEPTLESLCGLDGPQMARVVERADAVLTLAATYRREPYPLLEKVRPRILIETDPAYTHLWAAGRIPAEILGEHDLYYTVGGNVGSPRCTLPTLGIRWRPIWNPIVLDWWSGPRPLTRDRFTTIADWRGYGYLEFDSQVLGPKAEEFRKVMKLPQVVGEPLELALQIDPEDPDLAELGTFGWKVESPAVADSPGHYRDYVAGSRGEFSCAKGGYVGTRCGWFSDRSECYLAAGRPVVLQATGFEDLLPTGRGLFAFRSEGEAAEAIRAVRRDYALHAAAARSIALEHFGSEKILGRLLREAGISNL